MTDDDAVWWEQPPSFDPFTDTAPGLSDPAVTILPTQEAS
jgi:hypothetical protein